MEHTQNGCILHVLSVAPRAEVSQSERRTVGTTTTNVEGVVESADAYFKAASTPCTHQRAAKGRFPQCGLDVWWLGLALANLLVREGSAGAGVVTNLSPF
jgi:hypothetical protein